MPDLDDFHAFISTSSGSTSGGRSTGGSGCLTWVVLAVSILWIIGKLSG